MRRAAILVSLTALTAFHWTAADICWAQRPTHVKGNATATAPNKDGQQTVTITLEIEKGFYIYANPVNNEFLEGAAVKVSKVVAQEKATVVETKYSAGVTRESGKERFNVYEGTIKIEITVARTKGDASPLQVTVQVQPGNGIV